jgi:hypothetical protein
MLRGDITPFVPYRREISSRALSAPNRRSASERGNIPYPARRKASGAVTWLPPGFNTCISEIPVSHVGKTADAFRAPGTPGVHSDISIWGGFQEVDS